MKTFIFTILITLALTTSGFCGGTVEWDFHALPLLKAHPDLLKIITLSLDVSKTGDGVRLGKDFGDQQGKRIPPFEFPARPKGSTEPYTLLLIIHDPSGIQNEGEPNTTWIEIREQKQK